MQLIEVPAKAGYVWFRQGIWLFRRNPLAFIALFFTYMMAMMLISFVPVLGVVLPFLITPGAAVGFMSACSNTVIGKPFLPTILFEAFHAQGRPAAQRQLVLGGIYVVAMSIVLASSALGDGGVLVSAMLGNGAGLEPAAIATPSTLLAMLISGALYVPVAMLFWFAPVLCAWHDLPPAKALFFSVVACWRNRGAFLVYGLLWFALTLGMSCATVAIMAAVGAGPYALAAATGVSIIASAMLYCSFYATYRGCFGVQETDVTPLPSR